MAELHVFKPAGEVCATCGQVQGTASTTCPGLQVRISRKDFALALSLLRHPAGLSQQGARDLADRLSKAARLTPPHEQAPGLRLVTDEGQGE